MGKYPECSFCCCSGPGCEIEHSPEGHRREQELQKPVERDRKDGVLSTRCHAESILLDINEQMRLAAHGNNDVHDIRQIAHKGLEELLALIPR